MKKIFFTLLSLAFLASCREYKEVTFSGIENFKIVSLSQKGAEAEITAKIKNPNKVGFKIYPSAFETKLSGINLGKSYLTKKIKIKANSEQTYTFKVKSDFSKINFSDLPKIMSIASGKNVTVSFKGDLKAGKMFYKKSVPVDFTKSVPLSGM